MKPVFQRITGQYGAGDCCWACLASIFEEPLSSFHYDHLMPPSPRDLMALTKMRWPALRLHNVDLATNYRIADGFPDAPGVGTGRWAYDLSDFWSPPTDGYWIASVFSQRLKRPVEDPYYPLPALHAVVMLGPDLAHDPNPNNEQRMMPLVQQTWWEPR